MEEDGEWTTYSSRRTLKKDKRVKWEDLITVFVDNMPVVTQAKWLMWAFSRFGKVVDAFIPASSRRGTYT